MKSRLFTFWNWCQVNDNGWMFLLSLFVGAFLIALLASFVWMWIVWSPWAVLGACGIIGLLICAAADGV